MAKTAMILKQQKKQKYSTREYNRCKICLTLICVNTASAVSASENWHTRARFPVSRNLLGKQNRDKAPLPEGNLF